MAHNQRDLGISLDRIWYARPVTGVDLSVEGKVAIVTGARVGGIGETFARALVEGGATVVVAARDRTAADDAAAAIGTGAVPAVVDVADQSSVAALADFARRELGGVDILVNNAGLMESIVSGGPILERSLEQWNEAFAVNLTGAFLCSRAVVPSMRDRGGGRIVNVISAAAYPPTVLYGVTKHALAGLTVALARELGKQNISVNGIAPGMVGSAAGVRMVDGMKAKGFDYLAHHESTVAKRALGTRDDLVGALMLLVSPAGDWITGQILHVDGGWVIRA
jgi:NAD(P)-dependent dehydrogenase (short-subunit alcohol dehydrogenase family)